MKWVKPHPFNAEAAERYNESLIPAVDSVGLYLQTVIADRLAGIEEALSAMALAGSGEAQRGFADVLARRAELEAQEPAPWRGP